jgi:signal peptidase I
MLRRLALVALVLCCPAAATAQQSVLTVPSESMAPTLPVNAQIAVDAAAFDTAAPRRGDVVTFHPPQGAVALEGERCGERRRPGRPCAKPLGRAADVTFLKRVVALPGDRVALRRGRLLRNGKLVRERHVSLAACGDAGAACHLPRQVTVPPGHVFLLGDHRGASDDSRHWGPIRRSWLVARVVGCVPPEGERCGFAGPLQPVR